MSNYRLRRAIKGVKAELAAKELARIHGEIGLTPKNVVNESRPKKAPLHPAFEWRDDVAAENYREYQARHLIRSVQIVTEDRPTPTPVYVHIDMKEHSRYEPVEVVIQHPDMFATALAELRRKLNSALDAVANLEAAAKGSEDSDRLMRVSLAVQAMQTAAEAVKALH